MPPPLGRVTFDCKEGSLGSAVSLLVVGERAYAVGLQAFAVYDISDPANIARLGRKEYNREKKQKLLGDRMGVAHELAVRKLTSPRIPLAPPSPHALSSHSMQGVMPSEKASSSTDIRPSPESSSRILPQARLGVRSASASASPRTLAPPASPAAASFAAPGSPSASSCTSPIPGSALARTLFIPGIAAASSSTAPGGASPRPLPASLSPRQLPGSGSPTVKATAGLGSISSQTLLLPANASPRTCPSPGSPSGARAAWSPTRKANESEFFPEPVSSSVGMLEVRPSFKPTAGPKPVGDTALMLPSEAFLEKHVHDSDDGDDDRSATPEYQHRLFIAGSNGVVCYDVTNPEKMERILRFEFGTDANHRIGNKFGVNIVVKSSRLYAAGHYGMTIFKIANLRKVRRLCRVKYGARVKERLAESGAVIVQVSSRAPLPPPWEIAHTKGENTISYRCLLAGHYGMLLYDTRNSRDVTLLGCVMYGNNLKARVGNGEVDCCIMDDGTLVVAGHYRAAMWKGAEDEDGNNVEGVEYVGSIRYNARRETEIGDRVTVATKGTFLYVAGFYGATAYNVERPKFIETVGQIRYAKTLRQHVGNSEAGVDIAVTPDVVILLGCYSLRAYDATQPKLWTGGDTSRRSDCAIM